jgi:hypothetical protein
MLDYDTTAGLDGSNVALPKDQFARSDPPSKDGAYVSPVGNTPSSKKGCEGIIKKVNKETHSYEVNVIGAEAPLAAVPRLLSAPGDARLLPVGCRVAISYDYGRPLIIGCLPYTVGRDKNRTDLSISGDNSTGGASDLDSGDAGGNYRTPNMPNDLGPGDEGIVSPDGNAVMALQGGVNVMKSGMAEVRTHMINDLLELLCRNYKLHTDMGFSEVKNEGGRVTWSFRGGADQLTESGSDQENWAIRMDLGAEGDLFNFELTKPDGGSLFKLHVDSDGKLEVFAKDGIDEFSGADKVSLILANRETAVKGNDAQQIDGNQTKVIQGNRDTTVSGSDNVMADDHVQSVRNNQTISVGGAHKETVIGGGPLVATPLNVARETNIINGSWEVSIGDPLNGATPAALAGYLLQTFLGDIKMEVKTIGNVDFLTKAGNVTLETILGLATLKTTAGIANVDGTFVHLGPTPAAAANPLIKGAIHATVFGAHTAANIAALTPAIAATGALVGVVGGAGSLLWPVGPIMAPAFATWAAAIMAALTALLASNTALAGALASTLSLKSFTA